jgi:squalene-hopene/tetraprenyl-beta-curcumene cyclase
MERAPVKPALTPVTSAPTSSRREAPKRGTARAAIAKDALDAAIARAQKGLLALQEENGAWDRPNDLGPTTTAFQLVVEKWIGVLDPRDTVEGAKGLFAEQRADGSFPPWPTAASGTLCATAMVYAALTALGAARDPRARKARAFLDRHGGFEAVLDAFRREGDLAAVGLLLAGLVGPEFLPKLGLDVALLPFERLIESRVHGGNLMGMVALMALRTRFGSSRPRTGLFAGFARGLERARVETFVAEYQEPNGSWNNVTFFTLLPVIALHAVGVGPHEPSLRRALTWLASRKRYTRTGLRVLHFPSDVWCTGFAMLGLAASGVPSSDERLQAATEFLLRLQIMRPQHRQLQRQRDVQRFGGWPFSTGIELLPDVDDTGVVLAALGACADERADRSVVEALKVGAGFVRAMQNPDGGFPSYVWGHPRPRPGPMFLEELGVDFDDPKAIAAFFLDPPAEYGDPSQESVTARVLWALAACGARRQDPAVARAIAFLQRHQCDTGGWWGRWIATYLPATAQVLMALARVGEDMGAPYVSRAVAFLLARQNEDGGWGDTTEAYRNPALAGVGPSDAPVTSFVILGLLAAVGPWHEAVERGVAWLLANQRRSDGLWDIGGFVHCFVPPTQFFTLSAHAESTTLWALGEYRRARTRTALRKRART